MAQATRLCGLSSLADLGEASGRAQLQPCRNPLPLTLSSRASAKLRCVAGVRAAETLSLSQGSACNRARTRDPCFSVGAHSPTPLKPTPGLSGPPARSARDYTLPHKSAQTPGGEILTMMEICFAIPWSAWTAIVCLLLFALLWLCFWRAHRGTRSFYFDPQDFAHYERGGGRELPVAATTATFATHLKSYVGVMQLLITVAAASIAFGSTERLRPGVFAAKIILAFSILYGVLFSGLLQYFYDEYSQNVRAYTRFRYSLIEALGFSTLVCFVAGYLAWAFNLG